MPYANKADQAASARRHYLANKEKMIRRAALIRNRRRADLKEMIDEVKRIPCLDCGISYDDESFLMEFDHVRGIKLAGIADLVSQTASLDLILKEIEKCEVVCCLCHRRRTHSRLTLQRQALEAR